MLMDRAEVPTLRISSDHLCDFMFYLPGDFDFVIRTDILEVQVVEFDLSAVSSAGSARSSLES